MILHIISYDDWARARIEGVHRPPSLQDVGFTHCSDVGTVLLPAHAVYAGRTDLMLLVIDPARVGAPVRWEDPDPPTDLPLLFPHVYGPIPVEAVVAVHDFPLAEDGTFHLPAPLAQPGTT